MNPLPQSFQVPWPLSIRSLGLGSLSLSEEHVRALTTHKIALRSTISCNLLPTETAVPVATWPLVETLCCSCLCSLFDHDVSDRRESSFHAQRMLLASSIHRLALRASTGAGPPFLSSRLCVALCMLLIKIVPPHNPAPAISGSLASASSQPPNLALISPSANFIGIGHAQDDLALAQICSAAGRTWNLLSQTSLDTDLFLCSSALLDAGVGMEMEGYSSVGPGLFGFKSF